MKRAVRGLAAASLLILASCSTLVTGLRQDLDDSGPATAPVYGGTFDRGFLSESEPERGAYDRYASIGHSERAPASKTYPGDAIEHDSWAQNSDERRRDLYRGQGGSGFDDENTATTGNSASVLPQTRRKYKNGNRASRADFIDESPNEGSLWASDGQTNYYFTKNKTRGVGDIVTLNIEDGLIRDMQLEMRRKLSPGEMAREISNAQMRIRAKLFAGDASDPADLGKDRAPASKEGEGAGAGDAKKKPVVAAQDREIPVATEADIDLSKSVELKAGETMLAEILERYPNGAYKIRGTKKIPYKNGAPRLMTMVGVVRGSDISDEDVVASGKLYEYRLDAIR